MKTTATPHNGRSRPTETQETACRPCRLILAAPVEAQVIEGVGRLNGAWFDFAIRDVDPYSDVSYTSYPAARVLRVEWLTEEWESAAGGELWEE